MKKNNKIILSALISSLFAFNASAFFPSLGDWDGNTGNTGNTGSGNTGSIPALPTFDPGTPKEITELGYRLSIQTVKPTLVRMKSLYSTTDYVLVKMTHNYWDPNSKTIKKGNEFLGGMYLDGKFTDVTLPAYATQVNIELTDDRGKPLPGMQNMKLCAYSNPIMLIDDITPKNSQIELAFIKNDRNQLDAKIGLPTDQKEIFYSPWYQFGECK